MNHQLGEHFHANHGSIDHNMRIKTMEVEDATPPPINQASTSSASPYTPVIGVQPNFATQHR